ncbi:hypothetical protein AN619_20030 [Thermotalea metallivorans]|uniref:Uncharacterized protein n=2 Tax=Thermotalea metallivorans TaxID=520762 RepID=A0A140L3A8_9FIRM|nr:hypothetical protein AN619_20030 [Thermotalea metallivorans]
MDAKSLHGIEIEKQKGWVYMEDRKTVEEVMHQMTGIEKNNFRNMEHISGIDLLLTSDNNGTVKDAQISSKFNELKKKLQETNQLTKEFMAMLKQNHK